MLKIGPWLRKVTHQKISKFISSSASFSISSCSSQEVKNILTFPLTHNHETPPTIETTKKLPSVTRILSATKPPEQQLILLNWKKKMIAEMGEEGFNQMQKGLYVFFFSIGQFTFLLYQCDLENFLRYLRNSNSVSDFLSAFCLPKSIKNIEKARLWMTCRKRIATKVMRNVLTDVGAVGNTEFKVVHSHLGYSGYLDCSAVYKGTMCVIDWKTSKKRRYRIQDCYDDPVQVVAYAGALNHSSASSNQITNGLVVKIYHDGQTASVFCMNEFMMDYYWQKWLQRLSQFHKINK
ncbi:mitochondrial genome maintenance exonuclease 1 [Ciona intestinalis]